VAEAALEGGEGGRFEDLGRAGVAEVDDHFGDDPARPLITYTRSAR
jgi:hypothetical protein